MIEAFEYPRPAWKGQTSGAYMIRIKQKTRYVKISPSINSISQSVLGQTAGI
jgi:hypothetical protein